ncbi:MAG: hypothetical protein P8010_21495 [Desulfosarcinaceae bacterium]|jgi:hypothetical protein
MNSNRQKDSYIGLASLFDAAQLRSYFLNYLYFIIGVEILVFLVTFLGHLGPEKGPFPWKFYFYVAFVVPIAITFLLGVFIIAFNRYIFGNSPTAESPETTAEEEDAKARIFKLNAVLRSMSSVPFLPALFALVAGSMLVYKLDAIFLFILNAGEKAVSYILISGAALLGAGIIIGLIWVVTNYKLSKKHMEHEYRYRKDVMQSMGFLILDDHTVINKEGQVVSYKETPLLESEEPVQGNLKILPPAP